jgi:hypothetical protein
MLIAARQRVFLWVTTLIFVAFILGRFDTTVAAGMVFRVALNGMVSSVCMLAAAALISSTEEKAFRAGIVLWLVALASLFLFKEMTILTLHF